MKLAGVLGALGLLVLPAVASADPIILFVSRDATTMASVDPTRPSYIHVSNMDNPVVTGTDAAGPGGFATSAAFLVTGTDPANLWGRGQAFAHVQSTGWADAQGSSFYYVGIRLDQPYDFRFDADFSGDDSTQFNPDRPDVTASWIAMLRDAPTGSINFRDTGDRTATLTHSGRLAAGDWQLYISDYADAFVRLGGNISATSDYTFSLSLTPAQGPFSPTPEPASMLLLGSGVAGLFASRRRR